MRIRKLPNTVWDISVYNLDYYGYGDVDIFADDNESRGERAICIFRQKDLGKYNDENCHDFTFAILCNDCGIESRIRELRGLNAGQIIPVQFNGEYNPTIPLEWIREKFWRLTL